ncbi:MAG: hypothetical protein V1723_04885 [Candidatus Uhrbacteria bacterium]
MGGTRAAVLRETKTLVPLRGTVVEAYRRWRFVPMATKAIVFDKGQIGQLIEIDAARIRRGAPGIGSEVHELIVRLTSGGVGVPNPARGRKRKGAAKLPDRDPRILAQAKTLWDKGWAAAMLDDDGNPRYRIFADYLATIPEIPVFPDGYNARFPRLILVDQRIVLTKACQLLGVKYDGNDQAFVPHDPAQAVTTSVYWMRCQDGRIHQNRKPADCRTEFAAHGDEVGLSAFEGLSLYAQHPEVIDGHFVDLPGSFRTDDRGDCAYLRRWGVGVVRLVWSWGDDANPSYGSASRGIV